MPGSPKKTSSSELVFFVVCYGVYAAWVNVRMEIMAQQVAPLARQLPHGLSDLFFEEAAAKDEQERILERTFRRWGYQRIIVPTFEYDDCLSTSASPQLRAEMYRFFDREGHVMALRPDMTVPTARVVGTKLYEATMPLRFFYVGNVFRYEEPQAGRRCEFTQTGVELIGANTPQADTEVLSLVVSCLRAVGITQFQLNVGQVAFLKAILAGLSIENGRQRRLEQAIGRKNDVALRRAVAELGIAGDAARAVLAIPHLCGGADVLDEAHKLCTNDASLQAIERLAAIYRLAGVRGIADHVILDLSEVRDMDYYTGMAFHGYVAGLGFAILNGGRYDGLVANFGADLPAVGFAMGIERSMLVAKPKVDISPDLLVSACEHPGCNALVEYARGLGLDVEADVLGLPQEALSAYGRERGARRIAHCVDDGAYLLVDSQAARRLTRQELEKEMPSWVR